MTSWFETNPKTVSSPIIPLSTQDKNWADIAKILLPLIPALLSANSQPTLQPVSSQLTAQGTNLADIAKILLPLLLSVNSQPTLQPASSQLTAQGIDFEDIIKKVLPLIPALMSANSQPTLQPTLTAQGIGELLKIILMSTANSQPTLQPASSQLTAQGIDFKDIIKKVLPLIPALMSANSQPTLQPTLTVQGIGELVKIILMSTANSQPQATQIH
ncbi:hypothetical protein [Paenibacillus sp. FSL R10-2748]|uniref:hypothetical protein n=1 Tax=Paenibacillus sp. FSL R10-2748 TaxID=2954658 RepID=UPI0030FA2267